MQNKSIQNRPTIAEETFDFTDADYKAAVIKLYRDWKSEFAQLDHQYKDWVQTAQVYSYNRYDTLGNQIVANVKAYNETVVERKRLAIMLKLIEQQILLLESYWASKGYDVKELQSTVKTKQLQKLRSVEIVKKEEPVAETKVNDESPPMRHKVLSPTVAKVEANETAEIKEAGNTDAIEKIQTDDISENIETVEEVEKVEKPEQDEPVETGADSDNGSNGGEDIF